MRLRLLLFFVSLSFAAAAQKVDAIYFNLYTDSLKKGFYNYINVDGHFTDEHWMPLDSSQVKLTSNAGRFRGNDLFIDSSYCGATITVTATLKADRAIRKEVEIYIRKRGFDEPLKTNEQVLDEIRAKNKRRRNAP